jgi:UDP-N-acetylmuramyl pentapeptide synthase
MTLPEGVNSIRYGHDPKADIQIKKIQVHPETLSSSATVKWPDGRLTTFSIPSPAHHMAHNAVAAAAVGYLIGASPEQIERGIAAYQPTGSRLRLRHFQEDILVVDDAYNANPLSMSASIELMAKLNGRKIICLGDMLELGPGEVAIHKDVLDKAHRIEGALIATAGHRFAEAAAAFQNVIVADSAKELGHVLRPLIRKGDRLLLKGSRGLKMEHCLEGLGLKEQQ